MSRSVAPVTGKPYGLAAVCRVWRLARSGVYRLRAPVTDAVPQRRGPSGPMPDDALTAAIRAVLAAGPSRSSKVKVTPSGDQPVAESDDGCARESPRRGHSVVGPIDWQAAVGEDVGEAAAVDILRHEFAANERDTLTCDSGLDDGRRSIDADATIKRLRRRAHRFGPVAPAGKHVERRRRRIVQQRAGREPGDVGRMVRRQKRWRANDNDFFVVKVRGMQPLPCSAAAANAYICFAPDKVDDAVGHVQAHDDVWTTRGEVVQVRQKPLGDDGLRRRRCYDLARAARLQAAHRLVHRVQPSTQLCQGLPRVFQRQQPVGAGASAPEQGCP